MTLRKIISAALGLLLIGSGIAAGKDKENNSAVQVVDSGSFGIFMNSRRVATETFSIKQGPKGSTVTSEFKADGASDTSTQDSELQLNTAGELEKYEWKEVSPGKTQAVVLPNDNFLIERVTPAPGDKPLEQPFMLPASTSILDDYFFIQREVLVWKYLAIGCRQDKGQVQCLPNQKTQFGTLDPHPPGSSMAVSMAFSGKEQIPIRGVERALNRFTLKTENGDWSLWLDDQFKLVRILIENDKTEVLRD
ncbi:MAG: hypothetical protein ACRD2S_02815 [Terriglobales bacterium]